MGCIASLRDLTATRAPVRCRLYDARHGLREVRDPRGVRAIKNEYDTSGRLVATEDADGHRTEYAHNIAARQELFVAAPTFLQRST
jgi:YD repeat-containing protein